MNMYCPRKILRFVLQLSRWYTLRCESCSNFSVAFCVPENVGKKDALAKEENLTSRDKGGTLDSFTDNLMKGKTHKWESHMMKMRQEKYTSTYSVERHSDHSEETKHTNTIGTKCYPAGPKVSPQVIVRFFSECQKTKVLPGVDTVSFLLHSCAQCGDKGSIMLAKKIIKEIDPKEYQNQSGFDHYLAEAIWKNGNFEGALTLFWNIYKENILLRDNIKIMLKVLISDAISNKGEAVLVLITKFSKQFIDTYNDYILLSHVWEHCFMSEWHSDNQIAANLVEEYPQLKNIIGLRVHHISSTALISHKIDIVQRLFEVLLKYDMKGQYELVLRSLFDYACSARDMFACSAIIQSSHDLDVTLTEEQIKNFIQLFCQQDTPQTVKLPINTWHIKPSKFSFKF